MTEKPLLLHYCGPIAEPGKPARGGYESANRRLIDDLNATGLQIREYPYAPERRTRLGKYLAYGAGFAVLALRIALGVGRNEIFHITPLRDKFSLPEAVLCAAAKLRGAKLVVDMRAGTLPRDLASTRPLERWALGWMIRHADLLAYEGAEYGELLAPFGRPGLYLPNYVDAIGAGSPAPGEKVHLAYVGRVVPEKGIDTVIDCLRALRENGLDARLTVIGRGEEDYFARLQRDTADLPVIWAGAVPHRQVPRHLAGAHFFVFPTRHYGEGHSNALTEAMSQGLVPLAADNGFNSSIVGDTGVVLPKTAEGADYAASLRALLGDDRWTALSSAARQRIGERFSRDKVVPALVAQYRRLVGGEA